MFGKIAIATAVTFLLLSNVGAFGAAVAAEGNGFAPGELIAKFDDEIMLEFDGETYSTGLPAIDSINETIGVSYIEQVTPLPDE